MAAKRYQLHAFFGALVIVVLLYQASQMSWYPRQYLHQPHRPAGEPLADVNSPDAPGQNESPAGVDDWKTPAADHVGSGGSMGTAIPGTDGPVLPIEPETHLGQEDNGYSLASGDDATPASPSSPSASKTPKKENFPLPPESIIKLPTGKSGKIRKIQHRFSSEPETQRKKRLKRQAIVKAEMERAWAGYRKYAWMHDELSPISNGTSDTMCGWSATLIDSLDTLWIAGLKDEFDEAAHAARNIDFTHTTDSNPSVFETTIRHLGGLIAAYDVSGGASGRYSFLLDKAVELADIMMDIFDTPNRMPNMRYNWVPERTQQQPALRGSPSVSMTEVGSLLMEYTRLAQTTGQHKYYDTVDRITDELVDMQKRGTLIPGLFPLDLDVSGACNNTATAEQHNKNKTDVSIRQLVNGHNSYWNCIPNGFLPGMPETQVFTLGAGEDSAYEYFGKEYLLLGGKETKYQKLYEDAVEAVNEHLMFRPMIPGDWDIVFPATARMSASQPNDITLDYQISHLTCFVGGMYALGGKLFNREKDVEYAEKLTNACVWAYQATATGIMPESGHLLDCPTMERCGFNETYWLEQVGSLHRQRLMDQGQTESQEGLPRGFLMVEAPLYLLRPEAIESVWYMYRITGDPSWMEKGWTMFEATISATRTRTAHSAISNVLHKGTGQLDRMESFWLSETLKYYYLLYSEPSLISLDEWVLNTEAHPFKL